jgi:hypothetical protein
MPQHMTIKEAHTEWLATVKRYVVMTYGADDEPALTESWNNYTDALCKERQINELQYQHCPAWDDEIPEPDDEPGWILEQMGIRMDAAQILERSDNVHDWHQDATHWRCNFSRAGAHFLTAEFSKGPGLGSEAPEAADVLGCILRDLEAVGNAVDFEDWAEEMGLDTDSRRAERAYNAIKAQEAQITQALKPQEISDLIEVFEDV